MVSIAFALAACGTYVASGSGDPSAGHTHSATAADPTATGSPGLALTEATATPSAGNVSVQLLGFPSSITLGTGAVTFNVTLTNNGSSSLSDVAPLFQLVGGLCNCVLGSLERRDAPADAWQSAPMPEGDGDPNYLTLATSGLTLAPGQSINVGYRLTLSSQNPAKTVIAEVSAVGLPGGTVLAHASVPSTLAAG